MRFRNNFKVIEIASVPLHWNVFDLCETLKFEAFRSRLIRRSLFGWFNKISRERNEEKRQISATSREKRVAEIVRKYENFQCHHQNFHLLKSLIDVKIENSTFYWIFTRPFFRIRKSFETPLKRLFEVLLKLNFTI